MATTKRVTPGREGYKILFGENTVIMNHKFAAAAAKYGTKENLDQLKDFDVEIIKFENPFELVFQIMDKRKVSMEKAVEYLKEGFAKNQDDSVKPLKNFIDYLSSLLQDQPDDVLPVDQHKEVEANGQTLTLLEFLDGLPVMPELSVEEYLKETFEYLGHSESLEEILDQVGQELGVSTEEALAQLREAYETAEKEDKPLRLLNR